MTIDLSALADAARAATPGPWNWHGYTGYVVALQGGRCVSASEVKRDAAFIAAANPAVVLALIAEVLELRADMQGALEAVPQVLADNTELVKCLRWAAQYVQFHVARGYGVDEGWAARCDAVLARPECEP